MVEASPMYIKNARWRVISPNSQNWSAESFYCYKACNMREKKTSSKNTRAQTRVTAQESRTPRLWLDGFALSSTKSDLVLTKSSHNTIYNIYVQFYSKQTYGLMKKYKLSQWRSVYVEYVRLIQWWSRLDCSWRLVIMLECVSKWCFTFCLLFIMLSEVRLQVYQTHVSQ